MQTLNASAAQADLGHILDAVNDNHTPIIITRANGKPAVIMSLEDFNAYEETIYLTASPKNKARLDQAALDAENGKFIQKGLIEE